MGDDCSQLDSIQMVDFRPFRFSYPQGWVINPPSQQIAMELYFDEQTMNVAEGEVKYWEGIMRVREEKHTGKQIGIGYTELAGMRPSTAR